VSLTAFLALFQARARDPASASDAYALTTCDPASPLAALDRRPPHAAFHAALRSASPTHAPTLGAALRAAADLVALWRGASGADTYGAGFSAAAAAPSLVVVLAGPTPPADIPPGGRLPPAAPVPGGELTASPYRWDSRAFGARVGLAGVSPPGASAADDAAPVDGASDAVAAACEATGGGMVVARSLRGLLAWAEATAARAARAPCLVASLTRAAAPAAAPPAHPARTLVFRGGGTPLWPMPDGAVPGERGALPPRAAHPLLLLSDGPAPPTATTPAVPPNFPVDAYDVEGLPPPLLASLCAAAAAGAGTLAAAAAPPGALPTGWPVHVRNAVGDGGLGDPCGLLCVAGVGAGAAAAPTTARLVMLPHNYPMLFRLLTSLAALPAGARLAPPPGWRAEFGRYLAAVPPASFPPLRAALARVGLPSHLVPEPRDGGLPPGAAAGVRRAGAACRGGLDRVDAALAAHAARAAAPAAGVGGDPGALAPGALVPQLACLSRALRSALDGRPPPARAADAARGGRFARPVAAMGDYAAAAAARPPPLRDPTGGDDAASRAGGAFGNPYARVGRSSARGAPGASPPASLAVDEAAGEAALLLAFGGQRGGGGAPPAPRVPPVRAPVTPRAVAVAPAVAAPAPPPPPPAGAPRAGDAAAADAAWAAMLQSRKGAPAQPRPRAKAARLRRGHPRRAPDAAARGALVDALLAFDAAVAGDADAGATLISSLAAPGFAGDGAAWGAALAARAAADGAPAALVAALAGGGGG